MKKVLVYFLAALLVMAFAAPVAAKTQLTINGDAGWEFYYLSNMTTAGTLTKKGIALAQIPGAASPWGAARANSADAISDQFALMYGVINFNFAVSPALMYTATFKYLEKMWGGNILTDADASFLFPMGYNTVRAARGYMTYISPTFGIFVVGRVQAGPNYIYAAPWAGGVGHSHVDAPAYWKMLDVEYDVVAWVKSFMEGKAMLRAAYYKGAELDAMVTAVTGSDVTDADYDIFGVSGHYFWDSGAALILLAWRRDNMGVWAYAAAPNPASFIRNQYDAGFQIIQHVGPVVVAADISYSGGIYDYVAVGVPSRQINAWEWYFTGEYRQGPVLAGILYGHIPGQELTAAGAMIDTITVSGNTSGQRFRPLYAMFGYYDGLLHAANNFSVIALYVEYNIIENLWLRAAFGWAGIDEAGNFPGTAPPVQISTDFGSEIDLGAKYTITKGLNASVRFGYFMPGGWFESWDGIVSSSEYGPHVHASGALTIEY